MPSCVFPWEWLSPSYSLPHDHRFCPQGSLLHLAFEVLPCNQVGNIIVIILVLIPTVLFLQALVALRQLPQRSQAVGTELIEDTGDELGEFFVFAVAVNGKGVGGYGSVDCEVFVESMSVEVRKRRLVSWTE